MRRRRRRSRQRRVEGARGRGSYSLVMLIGMSLCPSFGRRVLFVLRGGEVVVVVVVDGVHR